MVNEFSIISGSKVMVDQIFARICEKIAKNREKNAKIVIFYFFVDFIQFYNWCQNFSPIEVFFTKLAGGSFLTHFTIPNFVKYIAFALFEKMCKNLVKMFKFFKYEDIGYFLVNLRRKLIFEICWGFYRLSNRERFFRVILFI